MKGQENSAVTSAATGNAFNSATSLVPEKRVVLSGQRWLMMAIFVAMLILFGFQYTQLSIINNVLVHYYHTSSTSIEWTSQVFSVCCVLLSLPSAHLLNKIGAKYIAMIAGTLGCVGSLVKLCAVKPNRFVLLMAGQILVAAAYANCYGMLALVPAAWFGSAEISFAGILPMIGIQMGNSLGLLIPPLLVHDNPDLIVVGDAMRRMHFSIATISTVLLITIVIFFKSRPKNPASVAQIVQSDVHFGSPLEMWKMMTSKSGFRIVGLIWAINMSILNLLLTVLSELILLNFPDGSVDAGNIGFACGICGMISSVLAARMLDKTRKFKEYSVIGLSGACISMVLFTMSLKSHNLTYVYVSAMVFWVFLVGSFCPLMQTCIEVTYPTPETVSVTALMIIGDVSTVFVTSIYSFAMKRLGDLVPNIALIVLLAISGLLACSIPRQFERQFTEENGKLSTAC